MFDLNIFKDKRVLITGHTGFKGAWLSKLLINLGASLTGYSLEPPTTPSLFEIANIGEGMKSIVGDIRDYALLKKTFEAAQPEIIFHLAAQPIVREGYLNPHYTYETNIMGTVNLLECVRLTSGVKSFLNITTDKVYENKETEWEYSEEEALGGYDPYSNSKSCSELVTHSYRNSFFSHGEVSISTARAGNVIGGGDFAKDRILPDAIRAAIDQKAIVVRNPFSIRPYQHVLDALYAYLMIAANQYNEKGYEGCYNVGPDECDCFKTSDLVELFIEKWGGGIYWVNQHDGGPHESNFLKLNCSKLKGKFGWKPLWSAETAVDKTVEWTRCWIKGEDVNVCMDRQIDEFLRASMPR